MIKNISAKSTFLFLKFSGEFKTNKLSMVFCKMVFFTVENRHKKN